MSLPGRVVVVGAGSGLGAALCAELAASGCMVVAGARRPSSHSQGVRYLNVDVTSDESIAEFAASALDMMGAIDGLVYCPAHPGAVARAWQLDAVEFAEVLDVSLLGFVRVVNHFVPTMGRQQCGSIIALGSQAGRVPLDLLAAYGAAKAALEHYTRCLASELLGTGVRANVLGIAAETPLTLAHRTAKAQIRTRPSVHPPLPDASDSVAVARWLLSAEARHVTGQTIEARQPDPPPTAIDERTGAFR